MKNPQHLVRANEYVSRNTRPVKLDDFLGEGTDGAVWSTDKESAVKVFEKLVGYANERDSYLRLAEYGITNKLNEFWVPRMIGYDDELMVVEMTSCMTHRSS